MEETHIVIVSSDSKSSKPLQLALDRNQFAVDNYLTVNDSLEDIKKKKPILIISDTDLPEINGFEFIETLNNYPSTKDIPVILLTQNNENNENIQGLEMGAIDCIAKPFKLTEVILRVKLRVKEIKSRQMYTPIEYFAEEARGKEMANQTGVFKFVKSHSHKEEGEIFIENGKAVYATCKDAIKEDAFLYLASQENICYSFEPTAEIPNKTFHSSITKLLKEAEKLNDEIDKAEMVDDKTGVEKRAMIVDRDLIPRVMMSRSLKKRHFIVKATNPEEIQPEWFKSFGPDVLIVDFVDAETVLEKLKPADLSPTVPVIVTTAKENVQDFASKQNIGDHPVFAFHKKGESEQLLLETIDRAIETR